MAGRGGTETTSYQDYDQGANSSGPIGEYGTEFEPQLMRAAAKEEPEEEEPEEEEPEEEGYDEEEEEPEEE